MRDFRFRGRRVDNLKWVEGDIITNPNNFVVNCIIEFNGNPRQFVEVIPETVGQLRHENKYGQYFDGDVYYHAGYGNEVVSDLCELQYALMTGGEDDICEIVGNIYDNPELCEV